MGCSGSKSSDEQLTLTVPKDVSGRDGDYSPPKGSASKLDPKEVAERRLSVNYQAKEQSDRPSRSRRSSAPFDPAHIGTKTKHGVAPGPGGRLNAKINQDRGVVCWPYAGSLNEALLCVFDGHGPKGEKVSDFCTAKLPAMLEAAHDALVADPVACLCKEIPALDTLLLSDPTLGRIAMTAGTTSTVLYMKGSTVWAACSGDSRAIKASRVAGKIVATDLTNDHKPDLPEEKKRILAAGGTVTPSGPGGRPSRVWSHGRYGLAMSRSLGDGECKLVGVVPDPEVITFNLVPPPNATDDGDLFVIVASDGVWEFVDSQEAAEIVGRCTHATEACDRLVTEAAKRWRVEEGSYRDDITAIVTFLPFLENWNDADKIGVGDGGAGGGGEGEAHDEHQIFLNRGAAGLAKLKTSEQSPTRMGRASSKGKAEDEEEDIVKRRLSVTNMFDEDSEWEKAGEEEEDDEH